MHKHKQRPYLFSSRVTWFLFAILNQIIHTKFNLIFSDGIFWWWILVSWWILAAWSVKLRNIYLSANIGFICWEFRWIHVECCVWIVATVVGTILDTVFIEQTFRSPNFSLSPFHSTNSAFFLVFGYFGFFSLKISHFCCSHKIGFYSNKRAVEI